MQKCNGHSLSHLTSYKLGFMFVLLIIYFRKGGFASSSDGYLFVISTCCTTRLEKMPMTQVPPTSANVRIELQFFACTG